MKPALPILLLLSTSLAGCTSEQPTPGESPTFSSIEPGCHLMYPDGTSPCDDWGAPYEGQDINNQWICSHDLGSDGHRMALYHLGDDQRGVAMSSEAGFTHMGILHNSQSNAYIIPLIDSWEMFTYQPAEDPSFMVLTEYAYNATLHGALSQGKDEILVHPRGDTLQVAFKVTVDEKEYFWHFPQILNAGGQEILSTQGGSIEGADYSATFTFASGDVVGFNETGPLSTNDPCAHRTFTP